MRRVPLVLVFAFGCATSRGSEAGDTRAPAAEAQLADAGSPSFVESARERLKRDQEARDREERRNAFIERNRR